MFLMNLRVFLFRINNNRNPPEPVKNLTEQTEKPIKTQCKPSLTEKTIKNKGNEKIFGKLRCLTVFRFFSNKMIKKHGNVELEKT